MMTRTALVSTWLACLHGRRVPSPRYQTTLASVAPQIERGFLLKGSCSNNSSANIASFMLALRRVAISRTGNHRGSDPRTLVKVATYFAQRALVTTMAESVGNSKNENAPVDMADLVARCIELGEEAGAKMREVEARPNLAIVDKGGEQDAEGEYVADPQTAADREVQQLCVSALLVEFHGIEVVAEEDIPQQAPFPHKIDRIQSHAALQALSSSWPAELRSIDPHRIVVYIDPLDGTGEFVKGNLVYVTNLIGIAVDGVPVAGIINQPWAPGSPNGRTVWGGRGVGVHGLVSPAVRSHSICTNRVVRSNRCAGALSALGVTPEKDAQRVSATGYNLLCVLEGQCDLFVLTRHGTKKWDTCGGEALLQEIGGIVTDAIGRNYFYGSEAEMHMNLGGVLAARNRSLHSQAARIIADTVAPWPLNVEDASITSSH